MRRGTFNLIGGILGSAAFGLFIAHPASAGNTAAGGKPGHGHDMFAIMDTNGDGRISETEHTAGAHKMFDTMDANGDGSVTATEMTAAHGKVTGKKAVKGELSAADKISAIDTNGDGLLSLEEHEAGSKVMFERMDTDHDGYLTASEFEAGHALLMRKTDTKTDTKADTKKDK